MKAGEEANEGALGQGWTGSIQKRGNTSNHDGADG